MLIVFCQEKNDPILLDDALFVRSLFGFPNMFETITRSKVEKLFGLTCYFFGGEYVITSLTLLSKTGTRVKS